MEELAKLRYNVDTMATYSSIERHNLINTAKYAQLHAVMLIHFVPEDNLDNSNSDLLAVAQVLQCAIYVYNKWYSEGRMVIKLRTDLDSHSNYLIWFEDDEYAATLCQWAEGIDKYAATDSFPTRRLLAHSGFIGNYSDVQMVRNLNRFMDAVTLFAYWTLIQDFQELGFGLLRNRLRIAIDSHCLGARDLGNLSMLPSECLKKIHGYTCCRQHLTCH